MLINNTVFKTPTVTLWSDTYEYGIGWYNDKGMAWSWYIPPEWHGVLTLNLLGFLVSEVFIYMNIQQQGHGSHVLAFMDSSSALGWMHKSSFDPVKKVCHGTVARWLGWTLVSNEVSLY